MTILPLINLNGSHGPTLLAQYEAACTRLADAITQMQAIDVHGRDYQTIRTPANAYQVAREEHDERLRKLSTLHYEMEIIITSLRRQIDPRSITTLEWQPNKANGSSPKGDER